MTTHALGAPDTDRMPWPKDVVSNSLDAHILTPRPPRTPRINGASVFGARPGAPIRFKVPATGERPIRYEADLPDGLRIDRDTGVITGRLTTEGDYVVHIRASNALGTDEAKLNFKIGPTIGLTPPMGWNSWNCWGWRVTQQNVEDSAHAMVDAGLIDHGWTYINIDDTWQAAERGGPHHAIQGNERFPDIAGLCARVHEMGLKVGIYSSPWITSYAYYPGGSSDHEDGRWDESMKGEAYKRFGKFSFVTNDAKQWADWGIDYVKYDWHPNDPAHTAEMRHALDLTGRDIVFSLSNSAPIEHADVLSAKSNLARTTGDIRDRWSKGKDWPYEDWAWGLTEIWDRHEAWRAYSRPGFFADADMMVVGEVSWTGEPKPSGLTPDEQYTHVSLWCLWSSPLLIGCPIERLDRFTLSLLTNDEVIAINQDPLGIMAKTVASEGQTRVIAKRMADGSIAVGLFNRGDQAADVTATWQTLGIGGRARVRDLWRQRDLEETEDSVAARVNAHGVVLLRLWPGQGQDWSSALQPRGPLYGADSPLRGGDRIVFFGDSITQEGSYIELMRSRIRDARPDLRVELLNRGIGGNKVPDLLARYQQDVLEADPTAVVIYIGINDVWHWTSASGTGTTREEFEEGLRTLVADLLKRGIAVLVCGPSVIGEKPRGSNPLDPELDAYADISRAVANDLGVVFCDLREPVFDYLMTHNPEELGQGVTTTDGVHMGPRGSALLADQIARKLSEALSQRPD